MMMTAIMMLLLIVVMVTMVITVTDLISACQSNMHQPVEVCQVLLGEWHIMTANCHHTHQFVCKQTATLEFITNRQGSSLNTDKRKS